MIYQDENTGIGITPFTKENHMSEEYRSWFNDPLVTRWNSHGLFPYTKKKMEDFVNAIEGNDGTTIIWAIEDYGRHIGNCSIQSINWFNRSAEIAFVIGNTASWGKGVASLAGSFMLCHAFNVLNLHRVWTGTAAPNIGMQKVAMKIGMSHEAIFRDAVFLNGRYEDVLMYGILSKEFTQRYNTGGVYVPLRTNV